MNGCQILDLGRLGEGEIRWNLKHDFVEILTMLDFQGQMWMIGGRMALR